MKPGYRLTLKYGLSAWTQCNHMNLLIRNFPWLIAEEKERLEAWEESNVHCWFEDTRWREMWLAKSSLSWQPARKQDLRWTAKWILSTTWISLEADSPLLPKPAKKPNQPTPRFRPWAENLVNPTQTSDLQKYEIIMGVVLRHYVYGDFFPQQ